MKIGNMEVYGIIYKVANLINGKVYIGQTAEDKGFNGRYRTKGKGIERLFNYYEKHIDNSSCNIHLYYSIKKYGLDAFEVIEIFDTAFSKDELDIKEDMWIYYYDCIKNGYNNKCGGANGKHTDETKKYISDKITKHYKQTTEQERKLKHGLIGNKNPRYGVKLTQETKDKISKGNKGKLVGSKNNLYGIHRYGKDNPNYGKHLSAETKAKISKSKKGKPLSEEHIEKMKNSNRNIKVICLTTDTYLKSAQEAMRVYNICSSTGIIACCKKKRKSYGKHPITGEPLRWMYYNDYIKQQNILDSESLSQAI